MSIPNAQNNNSETTVDSSKLRFEIKVCIAMGKTINVVEKKNLAFGNTVMKVLNIRIMINVPIYNTICII